MDILAATQLILSAIPSHRECGPGETAAAACRGSRMPRVQSLHPWPLLPSDQRQRPRQMPRPSPALVRSGSRRICGNISGANGRNASSDGKPVSSRGGASCGASVRARRRSGYLDHPAPKCRRTVCRVHRECRVPYSGCQPARCQGAKRRQLPQRLSVRAFQSETIADPCQPPSLIIATMRK